MRVIFEVAVNGREKGIGAGVSKRVERRLRLAYTITFTDYDL